jgi:hypothetical protein
MAIWCRLWPAAVFAAFQTKDLCATGHIQDFSPTDIIQVPVQHQPTSEQIEIRRRVKEEPFASKTVAPCGELPQYLIELA